MRGQRGTLRALAVICQSLKLVLVSGSLFSETSARITSLFSTIMADLS